MATPKSAANDPLVSVTNVCVGSDGLNGQSVFKSAFWLIHGCAICFKFSMHVVQFVSAGVFYFARYRSFLFTYIPPKIVVFCVNTGNDKNNH